MVAGLAAGLQVDLIHPPVVQLLAEGQGAHLLHHVQLASTVEVQDWGECPRVPVKEVLILLQVVVITDLHEGVVCVAVSELTQPGPWQPVQGPPENLVGQPPHIELDPAGAGLAPDDLRGVRRQRGSRARSMLIHPQRHRWSPSGWMLQGAVWGRARGGRLSSPLLPLHAPELQEKPTMGPCPVTSAPAGRLPAGLIPARGSPAPLICSEGGGGAVLPRGAEPHSAPCSDGRPRAGAVRARGAGGRPLPRGGAPATAELPRAAAGCCPLSRWIPGSAREGCLFCHLVWGAKEAGHGFSSLFW